MTDIVQRLRAAQEHHDEFGPAQSTVWREAADEIERLREALRAVLGASRAVPVDSVAEAARLHRQTNPGPKVVDLMAALEASVAAAKEARLRHRGGSGTAPQQETNEP